MPQDPIEEAAKTYDGWRELAWEFKSMIATLTRVEMKVDSVEAKVDRQIDTEINNLKLQVALQQKDIETGKREREELKKEVEAKTTDNRWIIGLIFSLVAAVLGLYGVFKPH